YVTVPWDVTELDISAFAELGGTTEIIAATRGTGSAAAVTLEDMSLTVGRNYFTIFVYDDKLPYYQDMYALIIDRLPMTGVNQDLSGGEDDSGTALSGLTVRASDGTEL